MRLNSNGPKKIFVGIMSSFPMDTDNWNKKHHVNTSVRGFKSDWSCPVRLSERPSVSYVTFGQGIC